MKVPISNIWPNVQNQGHCQMIFRFSYFHLCSLSVKHSNFDWSIIQNSLNCAKTASDAETASERTTRHWQRTKNELQKIFFGHDDILDVGFTLVWLKGFWLFVFKKYTSKKRKYFSSMFTYRNYTHHSFWLYKSTYFEACRPKNYRNIRWL